MARPVIRILVAEPYPVVMRGICLIAETKPYFQIVGEAQSGREALQLAIDIEPDIAVVAYSLPGLNGADLAHAMRRCCPNLEVLLYTMHDRDEIVVEAVAAGIHGIVLKTAPESELLAALDALSVHRPYFSTTLPRILVDQELGHPPPEILTHREREIVQLISEGRTSKEAANVLGVSARTIEAHRWHAMTKLELRTTADLVRYAARNNLILA
jgi:DNA-binding NarL/FixJ family response regulator